MSTRRTIFAAVIALAVVACTDAPVAVETDLEPQFARGGPLVHSVTGAGHTLSGAEAQAFRQFSVTAHERADGTVSGQFQLNIMGRVDLFGSDNPAITRYLHADVICLEVDLDGFPNGPVAWVAGVITNSSIPGIIGKGVLWSVQDRGNGNAAPDLLGTTTPFPLPGDDEATPANAIARCEAHIFSGFFSDVRQGNIQVR